MASAARSVTNSAQSSPEREEAQNDNMDPQSPAGSDSNRTATNMILSTNMTLSTTSDISSATAPDFIENKYMSDFMKDKKRLQDSQDLFPAKRHRACNLDLNSFPFRPEPNNFLGSSYHDPLLLF